jgi:signal transduction histidine kinase
MWINHKYQLRLSVRTKGMVVFLALIMYALSIAIFAFHQKELMLNDFEEIQVTLETETLLKQAEVSAFHTVMAIFATVGIKDTSASMQRIQLHYQSLNDTETDLMQRLPADALNLDGLHAAWDIVEKDASRSNLDRLSVELIKTKDDIATLMDQLQNQRKSLSDHYRTQSDAVAATTLMLGILGLGLLGAIIGLFFRRLTDDLRILQTHALGIVKGVRSQPLTITRHDEIGQLMIAVNQMADIVDRREKELMLERQKYFHQEKMAAIGALAAGVAHEIGNPIAAISGIAQAMIDSRKDSKSEEKGCMANDCANCHPELIYTQTQRLAAITREIAEFASPRAIAADFLDLNEQLRNASKLIRYDKRLQGVLLELNLDSQLNAVYGVADQLTQLIMNLLINSMDALEGITHALNRTPAITITSSQDINNIYVIIEDNGCGIEPHTLQRVFEAFFTTKPAGKGTGLGLSLCYSIAQNHGGNIDISSSLNIGTRVTLTLPMNLPLKEINFI